MKKRVLSLSIATALVDMNKAVTAVDLPNAVSLRFGYTGCGHILLVPYYSVRSPFTTSSDEVFDFSVFLKDQP